MRDNSVRMADGDRTTVGVAHGGEVIADGLPTAMDTAADGSEFHVEGRGDLLVGQSLDVAEDDCGAEIGGQRVERSLEVGVEIGVGGELPQAGDHPYQIAGKSCLAGDIFGEARFAQPLKVGDRISVQDAAGYTMVKKNWFNGVAMPAICIRERDGTITTARSFGYDDYRDSLS